MTPPPAVAEPPLGEGGVGRIDGTPGEGHVPGEEPMIERSFDDEHLRPIGASRTPISEAAWRISSLTEPDAT